MTGELVFARMRDCACPGTPHADGDGVWLTPTVSLAAGLALERDLQAALEEAIEAGPVTEASLSAPIVSRWLDTLIRYCAVGWNLVDELGDGVPWDPALLLADYNLARPVADIAADLYTERVLSPLALRLSAAFAGTSTAGSTPPRPSSTRTPRRRSSRATSAATAKSAG